MLLLLAPFHLLFTHRSNKAAIAGCPGASACSYRCCGMQIWDLRSKRSVQTLTDSFQVLSVCFADAGDSVFSAGMENTVKVCPSHL